MGKKIVVTPQQSTVGGLIEGAFSEIGSLAEEMREAYDNTPESLQQSGAGEARGTAADELENHVDAPDVHESLVDLPATYTPLAQRRRGYSRSDRRSQATYELQVAVDALGEVVSSSEDAITAKEAEIEQAESGDATEEQKNSLDALQAELEKLEEKRDAAQELIDELDNAISEVDGVEFPGMYG